MGIITGLKFPQNLAPNSAIRLSWSGSNLLPRTSHTAIWQAKYYQQTGYYAVTWHHWNDGAPFHATFYEYGAHPYPAADGTVDANGQALTGSGTGGTIHFWEIAGIGGHDYLCTAGGGGGTNISSVLDTWVTQARTCEVVNAGATIRHKFYPDVVNNSSLVITQDITTSDFNTDNPTNPAFSFGSSPWQDNAGGTLITDETPGCVLRGLRLFNAPLVIADIQSEAAAKTNAPVTSAGISSIWYSNLNPTVDDITDKSGAGKHPVWDTTARPSLYMETVNDLGAGVPRTGDTILRVPRRRPMNATLKSKLDVRGWW